MFVRIVGCEMDNVQRIQKMIADDSYAMSFQSMRQYRSALLENITKLKNEDFSLVFENDGVVAFSYCDEEDTILVVISKEDFESVEEPRATIGKMFYGKHVLPVERGSFIDEELQRMFGVRTG